MKQKPTPERQRELLDMMGAHDEQMREILDKDARQKVFGVQVGAFVIGIIWPLLIIALVFAAQKHGLLP